MLWRNLLPKAIEIGQILLILKCAVPSEEIHGARIPISMLT